MVDGGGDTSVECRSDGCWECLIMNERYKRITMSDEDRIFRELRPA